MGGGRRELLYWGPLLHLCLDDEPTTPLKGTSVIFDLPDASSLLSVMLFHSPGGILSLDPQPVAALLSSL